MSKKTESKGDEDDCIVVDRVDGRNVNDWHWTEWDAMKWLEGRAKEVFKRGVRLYESKKILITCDGLQWLKGDACVTNRKKKIGAFYELQVGINFKGIKLSTKSDHYGILEIPHLADENEPDEFEVNMIRGGGVRNIWLKKKTKWRRLKKLVKGWINELNSGACFKKRVQESIDEIEKKLEQENKKLIQVKSDGKSDGTFVQKKKTDEILVLPQGNPNTKKEEQKTEDKTTIEDQTTTEDEKKK